MISAPDLIETFPFPFALDSYRYSTNVEPAGSTVHTPVGRWGERVVDIDTEYECELAERATILAADPTRYAVLPHMRPACWDTMLTLMRELASAYPQTMSLQRHGAGWRWRNERLGIAQDFVLGDETTLPAVREGLAAAGRSDDDFAVVPEIIVSVGSDDRDHASTRMLLAFYGSTPAYRPVLDAHGWGDLQPELNAMSKQGRWQEMATLIDDEMLLLLAACGTPAEVAAHIRDRVEGVSDRICLYQPGPIAVDALAEIVDALV